MAELDVDDDDAGKGELLDAERNRIVDQLMDLRFLVLDELEPELGGLVPRVGARIAGKTAARGPQVVGEGSLAGDRFSNEDGL